MENELLKDKLRYDVVVTLWLQSYKKETLKLVTILIMFLVIFHIFTRLNKTNIGFPQQFYRILIIFYELVYGHDSFISSVYRIQVDLSLPSGWSQKRLRK